MRSLSAATTTRLAPDWRARSATRTTIGLPAMSASGLFGRRLEASRAGIRTVKRTAQTSGVRAGSLVFDVGGITRTWTGAVSADWNVGGNWGLGLVPVAADSVLVPTGVPNYPVLTGAATVSDVTVADNATLDVASFTLTSTGNVATGATAPSGIVASGTGQLALAGTGKLVHGRFPRTLVSGTYSLDGTYEGSAPQTVDNGKITSENFLMRLTAQ